MLVTPPASDQPWGARYEQMVDVLVEALKEIVDTCRSASNDNFCTELLKRVGTR